MSRHRRGADFSKYLLGTGRWAVRFVMPQIRVKLRDIVDGMTMANDLMPAYLDQQTGRVFHVNEDDIAAAEDADSEVEDWQREIVEIVRAMEDASDRFVPLPEGSEIDGYGMMRDFVDTVKDDVMRARLEESIRGSGAFRRFKDATSRLGLANEWSAFRDERYLVVAKLWCEREGVEAE